MTVTSFEEAAERLASSDRGRRAMQDLLSLLEDGCWLSLDGDNKRTLLMLLEGAFGDYPGSVRDAIHAALEQGDRV